MGHKKSKKTWISSLFKKLTPKLNVLNNTTRKLKKMNCSPVVKGKTANNNTCYTKDVLLKIRNAYNASHSDKVIETNDANEIWKQLKDNLVNCDAEDCWLNEIKDTKLRTEIDEYIFSPNKPPNWDENPHEWLSNEDIIEVIHQYEQKYPDFKFFLPSPIDFDTKAYNYGTVCVSEQICNLSIERELKAGKTKLGFIFNLDNHTEDGSHWVSLFVDLTEKFVFYFDSVGVKIPKEINVLKNRILKEGKRMTPPILLKYYNSTGKSHQRGMSECGMYSLYFIITMLTGETENKKNMSLDEKITVFKKRRIPDKMVFGYRDKYFNN